MGNKRKIATEQIRFLQRCQDACPAHLNFVQVVADEIGVSARNIYKYMDGTIKLTYDQAYLLSRHFSIELNNDADDWKIQATFTGNIESWQGRRLRFKQ